MQKIPSSGSAKLSSPSSLSLFSPPATPSLPCSVLLAGASASTPNPSSCRQPPPAPLPIANSLMHSPALVSSAIGLLTIAYNFLASRAYLWGTSAISGTVVSTASTFLYGMLLLWTHRRIVKSRERTTSRTTNLYNEPTYYNNYVQNMYPAAARSPSAPPENPITDEDRINQQMALLLMKQDSGTSPDASSTTFRLTLPEDHEERERIANSQELVGTPPVPTAEWNRARSQSRPDSLGESQAWERWQERGRTTNRPASTGAGSTHSRAVSREERRREIELGLGST